MESFVPLRRQHKIREVKRVYEKLAEVRDNLDISIVADAGDTYFSPFHTQHQR